MAFNSVYTTNPIYIKVGTLSENAIKTKICNFFSNLNISSADKRTKKRFSVFSLMNLILFVIHKHI